MSTSKENSYGHFQYALFLNYYLIRKIICISYFYLTVTFNFCLQDFPQTFQTKSSKKQQGFFIQQQDLTKKLHLMCASRWALFKYPHFMQFLCLYHRVIIYTGFEVNFKNSKQINIELIIKQFQTHTAKRYWLQRSIQKYRNPSKVFKRIFIELNYFFQLDFHSKGTTFHQQKAVRL